MGLLTSSLNFSLETTIKKGNFALISRKYAEIVTREPRAPFKPEYVADRTIIDLADSITVNMLIFGINLKLTLLDESNPKRTRRIHWHP